MRSNRFVFLNRPMLSLETHLGVTASPQVPFPADFVTLPVSGKSPPLRLTPSRSRRRACSLLQHQRHRAMHSRHAQATRPPSGRASLAGRTVGDVGNPDLVGLPDREGALQPVRCQNRWPANNDPWHLVSVYGLDFILAHDPGHAVFAAALPSYARKSANTRSEPYRPGLAA